MIAPSAKGLRNNGGCPVKSGIMLLSVNSVPKAELPRLGTVKPVVHRMTQPVSAPNPLRADHGFVPDTGVADSIITNGVSQQKMQQTAAAISRSINASPVPNWSNTDQVQRAAIDAPNSIVRAAQPAGASAVGRIVAPASSQNFADLSGADKFSGEDIDYLSSKVYQYIKRRLRVDRQRSGNPGFALWR